MGRTTGVAELRAGVLGPLDLRVGDAAIQVAAGRQQVALAMLLLRRGKVVSTADLIDAVWSENPPATAANQIAICISRLRGKLTQAGVSASALVTFAPGYRLDLPDGNVDIDVVDALIAEAERLEEDGDQAGAVERRRRALGQWRGPVLAGVASTALQPEITLWEEHRLTLVERCVELELALGRHADVIGELSALVTAHPLRERLRGQLMVALSGVGRQAHALQVYREGWTIFDEQLGIELGSDLQAIHQRILRGDLNTATPGPDQVARQRPAIDVGPRKSFSVPRDIPDFTGRAELVRTICEQLTPESAEQVPIVAVSGQGGVGKTTLAVHVAHRLRADFPDGQLYANLDGASVNPRDTHEVLAHFLRQLGVESSMIPDSIDERAALLRNVLEGQRILLVLDNVAGEEQVRPLLPGRGPAAVLVTSRVRLTGLIGASRLELDVFGQTQAIQLLRSTVGDGRVAAEPRAAAELVRLCGRLPLAVRIAGARLSAKPHWDVAELLARLTDERRRLDELVHGSLEIRASLELSYRMLDAEVARLFRLLGLLDLPDFGGWIAAPLLGTSVQRAVDLVERLVDAQLLEVLGQDTTGQTRYRFHDLVRLYAREQAEGSESAEDRAAAVCRVIGGMLVVTSRAHIELSGGDYAVLHGEGERPELDPGLVQHLVAYPVAWYECERASIVALVQQAGALGLDELCWDLAASAMSLFGTRNDYDEWHATHQCALAATTRAGNRRGEAMIRLGLGDLYLTMQRFDRASAQLDLALRLFADLGERHGHALALRKSGYVDSVRGDHEEALDKYSAAQRVFREVGDLGAEMHVLRWTGQLHLERGVPDLAAPHMEQALQLARRSGGGRSYAQALYELGQLETATGRLDVAERTFLEVLHITEGIGDLRGTAHALRGLGEAVLGQGRLDEAEDLLNEALSVARHIGERMVEARVHFALATRHRVTGALAEAVASAETSRKLFQEMGSLRWVTVIDRLVEEIRGGSGSRESAVDVRPGSHADAGW